MKKIHTTLCSLLLLWACSYGPSVLAFDPTDPIGEISKSLTSGLDKSLKKGFSGLDASVNNAHMKASLLLSQLEITYKDAWNKTYTDISGERAAIARETHQAIQELIDGVDSSAEALNKAMDNANVAASKLLPGADVAYVRDTKLLSPLVFGTDAPLKIVLLGANLGHKKNYISINEKKYKPLNTDETKIEYLIPAREITIDKEKPLIAQVVVHYRKLFRTRENTYRVHIPRIDSKQFEVALAYYKYQPSVPVDRTASCDVRTRKTRISSFEIKKGKGSKSCAIKPSEDTFKIIPGSIKVAEYTTSKHCENDGSGHSASAETEAGFTVNVYGRSDKQLGSSCYIFAKYSYKERKIELVPVEDESEAVALDFSIDAINMTCPVGSKIRGITIADRVTPDLKNLLLLSTTKYKWLEVKYDQDACLVELTIDRSKLGA